MNNITQLDKETLRFFIYEHKEGVIHIWGDEWAHWDELYQVEKELIKVVQKSRILADVKEKYGCIRCDFLSMYNGTLKSILQPTCRRNFDCYFTSEWAFEHSPRLYHFLTRTLTNAVNKVLAVVSDVDYFIASPHLPFYWECVIDKEDSKHPTLFTIDRWIREHIKFIPKWWIRWVQKKQLSIINEGYQKVCMRHPHLVHEIVAYCDLYKYIKPYDDYIVDGEEIHNMHWKSL